MNCYDFQNLAQIRLKEARALLRNRMFEGCYYLLGYVVECGLKACIARLTNRFDFPDKQFARDAYDHNLDNLLRLGKLDAAQNAESARDPQFRLNWMVVREWSERTRYETPAGSRLKSFSQPSQTAGMECFDG